MHALIKIKIGFLSEFALHLRFEFHFGFSFGLSKLVRIFSSENKGSGKRLRIVSKLICKNESTVWDTMGVQMIRVSALLTRNIRSFVDAQFFV